MSEPSVLGTPAAADKGADRSVGMDPGTCSAAGTGSAGAGSAGTAAGSGRHHQDLGKRPGYIFLLAPDRHSTDLAWGMAVGYRSS